jgi:transposase-like protein
MGFNFENHNQPSTPNQLNPSLQALPLKKRKHSIEFKIKAVKLCLEPGANCQKIADSLNLKSSMLYFWVKTYRDNNYSFPENAFARKKKPVQTSPNHATQHNSASKNQAKKQLANVVTDFVAVHPSQSSQSYLQHSSFNGLTEIVLEQGDLRIQLHYHMTELAQLSNLLHALRT